MISLKDDSESKQPDRPEPITARKDYNSESEGMKNSFRRLILGSHEEISPPHFDKQEESSDPDVSLMHGMPASMKKLRDLSADKSRYSNTLPLINNTYEIPPQESSSELDLDLKFLNKKNLLSGKSIPKLENVPNHLKSISDNIKRKPNPLSQFQPNPKIQTPKLSYRSFKNRNKSTDRIPKPNIPMKKFKEEEKSVQGYPQIKYLEDEVQAQSIRESLSRSVPRMRNTPMIKSKPTFGEV